MSDKAKVRPAAPHGCIWCGTLTRGRVMGHAACPAHMVDVATALAAPGRAIGHRMGGTVVTTVDAAAGAHRAQMGSIHVEVMSGPKGGRVIVDVIAGDRGVATVMRSNILRPSGARALAEALLAAAEEARIVEPWDEIPEATRVAARPAPASLTQSEPAQAPTVADAPAGGSGAHPPVEED